MTKSIVFISLFLSLMAAADSDQKSTKMELPIKLSSGTTFNLYCPAGGFRPDDQPADITYKVSCVGNSDIFSFGNCRVSKKLNENSFTVDYVVSLKSGQSENQVLVTQSIQEAMKAVKTLLEQKACAQ